MTDKIRLIFAAFIFLHPTWSCDAQECSEGEIMEMMRAGYSEAEIYNAYGYTLRVLKCCCETKRYAENGFFGSGEMEYQDTSYAWVDTYGCENKTYYYFFVEKREVVRQCVPDYFCE